MASWNDGYFITGMNGAPYSWQNWYFGMSSPGITQGGFHWYGFGNMQSFYTRFWVHSTFPNGNCY